MRINRPVARVRTRAGFFHVRAREYNVEEQRSERLRQRFVHGTGRNSPAFLLQDIVEKCYSDVLWRSGSTRVDLGACGALDLRGKRRCAHDDRSGHLGRGRDDCIGLRASAEDARRHSG